MLASGEYVLQVDEEMDGGEAVFLTAAVKLSPCQLRQCMSGMQSGGMATGRRNGNHCNSSDGTFLTSTDSWLRDKCDCCGVQADEREIAASRMRRQSSLAFWTSRGIVG